MPEARTKSELLTAAREGRRIAQRIVQSGTVVRSLGERRKIAECLECLSDAAIRALESGRLDSLPEG